MIYPAVFSRPLSGKGKFKKLPPHLIGIVYEIRISTFDSADRCGMVPQALTGPPRIAFLTRVSAAPASSPVRVRRGRITPLVMSGVDAL
jgi:hypothetical protein